ncbi:DNA-directed RNA polymerase I core subunit rpa12 [Savitreella phatthalungensis]
MSIVGSLVFCKKCGSLLDRSAASVITCDACGANYNAATYRDVEVVTRSAPGSFPSVLKQKRSVVQVASVMEDMQAGGDDNPEGRATIEEKCPKCDNPQMTFFTMQLRSADEGSTVFYECPRCAYKFSTNN